MKRKLWKAHFLAVALGAIAGVLPGCGSTGSSASGTSLVVISTVPANKATDVQLSDCPTGVDQSSGCGVYTINFNQPVDMNTLSVQITPPLNTHFISCPSSPSVAGCPGSSPPNSSAVVEFIGMNSFASDTSYKVTVVDAATPSPNVIHLSQQYVWTFTTAGS